MTITRVTICGHSFARRLAEEMKRHKWTSPGVVFNSFAEGGLTWLKVNNRSNSDRNWLVDGIVRTHPDAVVLFMATNDLCSKFVTPTHCLNELKEFCKLLRTELPRVAILIPTCTRRYTSKYLNHKGRVTKRAFNRKANTYNKLLKLWIRQQSNLNFKLLNVKTINRKRNFLRDGLHLSRRGNKLIFHHIARQVLNF